jgi:polyketide cyclase/dehydrase/lipid transport protein
MASVRTEVGVEADAHQLWAVVRDFASGPLRMAPGHVVDSRLADGDATVRVVTFANGLAVRERLVAVDDQRRRIVYALLEAGTRSPEHDNATMHVVDEGAGRCRFIWIHDVLPDDLAAGIHEAMEQGAAVIKRTLEAREVRPDALRHPQR